MVEIGGRPILWHIMKSYSNYGYNKFILALGYKGYAIKSYFYNARINQSDFTIKMDPLEKGKKYGSKQKNERLSSARI